jgi:hypothetical protein
LHQEFRGQVHETLLKVNGLLRKTDAGGNQQRTPAMVFDAACGKSTPLLKSCCERTEPPATFLWQGWTDGMGDTARAELLVQDLNKRYPADTEMQKLWVPAIRAQLALIRKNPADAVNTLQLDSPLEFGLLQFVNNISCLYPTYIKGQAYLGRRSGTIRGGRVPKNYRP